MILQLLKGRGMVLGLFEKKQDAIPPHLKHCKNRIPEQHCNINWEDEDVGTNN
jgi:hypothetical protein